MNKILHILKEPDSTIALEVIQQETENPGQEVSILLIQEAVRELLSVNHSVKVFVLHEDLAERGLSSPAHPVYAVIDYRGMLDLIYRSDRVVTW